MRLLGLTNIVLFRIPVNRCPERIEGVLVHIFAQSLARNGRLQLEDQKMVSHSSFEMLLLLSLPHVSSERRVRAAGSLSGDNQVNTKQNRKIQHVPAKENTTQMARTPIEKGYNRT